MDGFSRLYVEPVGGAAGDMILGALIDLGADRGSIESAFASLQRDGLNLQVDRVDVSGEMALSVRSIPTGTGHPHHHLDEIHATIARGDLPEPARARAREVFDMLGAAEARVHGGTSESVHLHEVGELDSVLDVVGIAVALHSLGDPEITCAPLPSGRGTVDTSHGVLDVPVPAVVEIVREHAVVLVDSELPGETVTPTGAAVLAQACASFSQRPTDGHDKCGVGAGTKRFEQLPNVVRIYGWR